MLEKLDEYDGKSLSMIKSLATCDVDMNGNWRVPLIMLDMQELAENHCQKLGCDFDWMRNQNAAWVLVKMEFRFYRVPKYNDLVCLKTYAAPPRRILHYRYFTCSDVNTGEKLFDVNTQWTIVDLTERKAVDIPINYPDNLSEVVAPFEITRVKLKDVGFENEKTYTPDFSDYDINKHVNNASYMKWVTDAFGTYFADGYYYKNFSLVFKNEVPYDKSVTIKTTAAGGEAGAAEAEASTRFAFLVGNPDDDVIFFECEGELAKFLTAAKK